MFDKTKNLILIFLILVVGGGFLIWRYMEALPLEKKPAMSYIKIDNKIIKLEIVNTPAKLIKGLSNRLELCPDCGMLFIFPQAQVQKFWMKNMNFPLDIIWINNNKIINISKNLIPEGSHPARTYSSILPVNYVLEINGGIADKWGFKIGDKIKLF